MLFLQLKAGADSTATGRNGLTYATFTNINEKSSPLATPNYSFEKRQRDLAKKQRKEEKLKRKSEPAEAPPNESEAQPASADQAAS